MRETTEPSGIAISPAAAVAGVAGVEQREPPPPDGSIWARTESGSTPTTHARFQASDVAIAGRLVALFGDCMRYCHPWNRWLIWDGKRWAEDQTGAAMRLAKRVAQILLDEAGVAAVEQREPPPPDRSNSGRTESGSTLIR